MRGTLRDDRGDEHGSFDLIAIADGAASALRAGIGGIALDRPYPWGAQWCLVPAGDWPWRDELRQRYRRARRMAAGLPARKSDAALRRERKAEARPAKRATQRD